MADWSHGYNVEQGYTYGVYRELAPDWMELCATLAGYVTPSEAGTPLRYLELGCGQGFGLCLFAANHPDIEFVGIDFSPEHIAHARALAAQAGLGNVRFEEADFLDLARAWPESLGRFDYAVLHGIYSWVPADVRAAIVACLDRALVSGGLAYASYNAMPGWAAMQPFQHIVARLSQRTSQPGATVLGAGIGLFERLKNGGAALFEALPGLGGRIAGLKGMSSAYLVQEYLHRNWHPLWFSQVAEEMRAAKLEPVASATLPENLLPALLPEPLRGPVAEIADPLTQQDLIDCAINQSFRRDLFARGRRKRLANAPGAADFVVHALAPPAGDTLEVKTSFGAFTLRESVFRPVFDALADGPKPVAALLDLGVPGNLLQALILLAHGGAVSIARPAGARDGAAARRFNAVVCAQVGMGAPYNYVATPQNGAAHGLRDVDLIVMKVRRDDPGAGPETLRDGLLATLAGLGRKLLRNDEPVDGDEAKAFADELVSDILANRLPIWKRLGAFE